MGPVAPAHNEAGAAHLQPEPRGAGRARAPPSAPHVLGTRPADRRRAACGAPRRDPAPGRPLFAAAGRSRAGPAAPRSERPPSWAPAWSAVSRASPAAAGLCAPAPWFSPAPPALPGPPAPLYSRATGSSPVLQCRRSPSVPPDRLSWPLQPLTQTPCPPVPGPARTHLSVPCPASSPACRAPHTARAALRRRPSPSMSSLPGPAPARWAPRAGGRRRQGGAASVRVRQSVGQSAGPGRRRPAGRARSAPPRLPAPPPPAPRSAAARGAASASARGPGGRGH